MGCQSFLCFCSRVASIPNLYESYIIFLDIFGLINFREVSSLTIDLSLSKWLIWVTVKFQIESFLTSSLHWWVCSDSCGINLLRYAIMPKKRCRSCLDLEKGMSLIVMAFSGSGEIPFPDILFPKNISLVSPKTHSFLFSFKPHFRILFKTCLVRISS